MPEATTPLQPSIAQGVNGHLHAHAITEALEPPQPEVPPMRPLPWVWQPLVASLRPQSHPAQTRLLRPPAMMSSRTPALSGAKRRQRRISGMTDCRIGLVD